MNIINRLKLTKITWNMNEMAKPGVWNLVEEIDMKGTQF